MIFTTIINFFISLGNMLILMLPVFEATIPSGVQSVISNIFSGVGYFLPLNIIVPLVLIDLSFNLFVFLYRMFSEVRNWTPLW